MWVSLKDSGDEEGREIDTSLRFLEQHGDEETYQGLLCHGEPGWQQESSSHPEHASMLHNEEGSGS